MHFKLSVGHCYIIDSNKSSTERKIVFFLLRVQINKVVAIHHKYYTTKDPVECLEH